MRYERTDAVEKDNVRHGCAAEKESMMKKRRIAMLLVLCLIAALMAGCGKDEESGKNGNSGEKVHIVYVRPGTEVEHNAELVQAINDKLDADGMGIELEIMYIPSDTFQDKLNMMMTTEQEFDLVCVMEDQKPFTSFIANEGIIPITEYVKNSENLQKYIPDWMWESATVNGEIYTIPANWCETADQNCAITIRREKLREFGLSDPQTMDDLFHMCQVFAENWEGDNKPVVIPMFREPFNYLFRTLDTYPFTVQKDLIYIDQEGNVKNWLETDEFKQCAQFFRKLYENGFIPEDVLATGWSSWNTMLTGDFVWVDQCQLWDTEEIWEERIPGVDLDTIYLNQNAVQFRPNSFRNDTAVAANSAHPAEAVKFMDWVYASQENYDLMVYGVEGLTWVNEGDHSFSKIDPSFEFNADWMIGNMEYERYQKGTYEKFIEIMGKEKPDAVNSVILNFVFDPTPVSNEYVNCQAEVEQSIYPLKLGLVSYEEGYENALARMKAAGIDAVVAEYQRQVDEYLGK